MILLVALLAWLQSTIRRDSRFLRESTLLPVSPADVVKAGAGVAAARKTEDIRVDRPISIG